MSRDGRRNLIVAGFTPQLPPETRARCTVVCRKVDLTVIAHQIAEIIQEVSSKNAVSVQDVYIPPKSRIVKIRVLSPEEAQKLLRDGVRIFSTSVPAYNIEPESFIQIDQCFKCCRLDHVRSACTYPQRCTRCGEEGHFFGTCNKPEKCGNCGGKHTAVSGSCPDKKSILQKTRTAIKQQNTQTYAQTIQSSIPVTNQSLVTHHARSYQSAASSGISQAQKQTSNTNTNILESTINSANQQSHLHSILQTALILANHNTKTFAKFAKLMLQKNGYKDIEIPEECMQSESITIPDQQPSQVTHLPDISLHSQTHITTRHSPESPTPTPTPQPAAQRVLEEVLGTPQGKRKPQTQLTPLLTKRPQHTVPTRSVHSTDGTRDSPAEVQSSCDGESEREEEDSDSDLSGKVCQALAFQPPVHQQKKILPLLNPGVSALQREAAEPDSWSMGSASEAETASQCDLPTPPRASSIQRKGTEREGARRKCKYRGQDTPHKSSRNRKHSL